MCWIVNLEISWNLKEINDDIVTKAFDALVTFFFEEMQVNHIEARHDLNNPGSGKVMEKCGLIKEGVKRQGDRNNTGICDVVIYGLVRDDCQKTFSGRL